MQVHSDNWDAPRRPHTLQRDVKGTFHIAVGAQPDVSSVFGG